MTIVNRNLMVWVLSALIPLFAIPALAQNPTVSVETVACVPNNDNGVIRAQLTNEVGGTEPRLYFRWDEHGDFYWVALNAVGGGDYWAVPPRPIDENQRIEYYVSVVDPQGNVVLRSETVEAPVLPQDECEVELNEWQEGMAANLTVGETAETQRGESVTGFQCYGIVSRIGPDGIIREDDFCRRCVVALFPQQQIIIPTAVVAAGGISTSIIDNEEEPERSPSRP